MPAESRRGFLKAGTAALAAASQKRVAGAGDIINIGVIGLGGNGRGHLRSLDSVSGQARVVAVCDIFKPRLEEGVRLTGAKAYHDYRDLLQDPDIDAVIISTPDHWHAQMAIDAMRAGKDVDVEKPMALTVDEARRMVEVASETGRVLAVDSEHMAHGIWEPARAAVQAGVLGKLLWSQTSRSRNSAVAPWNYRSDHEVTPENLDWERWLGSTARVPFSEERFLRWRRYREYGGGIATDLFIHHLAPVMKVTGPEFPRRAVAAGGNWLYPTDVLEVPDTLVIAVDYPGKHTIMVGGSLANGHELPIVVRGHHANIRFHGPDHRRPSFLLIQPEAAFEDAVRENVRRAGLEGRWEAPPRPIAEVPFEDLPPSRQDERISRSLANAGVRSAYEDALGGDPALATDRARRVAFFGPILARQRSPRGARQVFRIESPPGKSFDQSFLDAIRTRGKAAFDGELGYMVQASINLAVESYRRDKVLFFDAAAGTIRERPA